MYKDIIVITSVVEPNPSALLVWSYSIIFLNLIIYCPQLTNNKSYVFFFTEGVAQRGFAKPSLDFIKVNQINAITHHCGHGNLDPLNHPRSAHNLLCYRLTYNSFSKRNNSSQWMGPRLGRNTKYRLFKQYKILNNSVILDDQCRARGEASKIECFPKPSSRRKKSKKRRKQAKVETLLLLGQPTSNPLSESRSQQLVQLWLLTFQLHIQSSEAEDK